MKELRLPIHASKIDPDYGRIDVAPRVMGIMDYDGELGYVLAVMNVEASCLLVSWDDGDRDIVPHDQVRWI